MRAYEAVMIVTTGVLMCGLTAQSSSAERPGALGVFEGQFDVGSVVPAGTGAYDSGKGIYTLTSAVG
jgi:hypothetical protein